MKYGRTLVLTCENGCAFVSSVYGSEVSFYHACQGLLAHEKVIFARKKKKGEHIVAGEILETVGFEGVATQSGDCMVVCFGLSVSF